MPIDVFKVIIPAVLTFFIGIAITPFFTHYFYKYKLWKKSPRTEADTSETFQNIHNTTHELSTPRIGGIIIWLSVLLAVFGIYLLSIFYPNDITTKLSFFSRGQTLIPLATLLLASGIGLVDDWLQIRGKGSFAKDNLVHRKIKIALVCLIGLIISLWFYFKLGATTVHVPFWQDVELGLWFIPFFILVMLATFSTSVIDGLDGLAGGIMGSIFTAYTIIAFAQNQIDIAAFSAAISGAILAFLWFNIPPARFYMGETGMLGLTVTLSVIAFLTDTVLLLPVIAFPLVATSLSDIIQITSYKYFNKHRVFKVAPLHHHFQALGWPATKVVMRYWIIGVISAILGLVLALLDSFL